MSTFINIRDHSRRGHYVLQALFAANTLALSWSALSFEHDSALVRALGFCLIVNLLAFALLVYLQRTLSARLEQACADDAERARLMRADTLTGAATRRHFLEELRSSLGSQHAPGQATLVLVDIDHFKQLNDSFGHPFGDAALAHVAATMKQLFPDGLVGRLGGDEFAILLRDCDIPAITRRAQLLITQLRAGLAHDRNRVSLSVSIGAALAPLHASHAKELMLLADLALYESKAAGRGRMTTFDTGMLSQQRHRRFIERELRAAIYLNQLELHYQPVVDADGSIYTMEGLVRWRHSVRGIIPPGEFVPIAEESNLIDTLGAWVFKQACLDSTAFPGCRININVSGEQLKRDEFIVMLKRVLEETGCSAKQFTLEITETAVTAATPEILRRLEAVRAMGFRVALDDFGTGFCGFNYLKMLPVDVLKIDRSYIQSLDEDEVARVFVSALAQIARIQKLVIVAEGVETQAHFALARAAGCNRFQGFHIARPAPREAFAHLFQAGGSKPRLFAG